MWTQFLLEILHFAISFSAALVFLSAFWLYFDSRKHGRTVRDYIRCSGLMMLSVSFVLSSIILETSIINVPLFQFSNDAALQFFFRSMGYLFVFVAAVTDKLQPKPKEYESLMVIPTLGVALVVVQFFPALLALCIAIAYLVRSVVGLEAHIRRVSMAFFLFALAEALSLFSLFRSTTNVSLYQLVEPFKFIWILQHVVLLLAIIVLAKWVFGYLLKQFRPQLFVIFSIGILTIFLITTTAFTSILLKNIQDETLHQLGNDVRVLQYALKSKQAAALSNVAAITQDPILQKSVGDKNRAQLSILAENYLLSYQYSSVLILDDSGQIISRGEDKDNVGSYLANDPLVKRALAEQTLAAMTTTDGALAPQISLQAAAPVKMDGKLVGVVLVSMNIDNAFVDGIKKETGLEASLYGQRVLSATTLLSSDRKTRLTGLTENNQQIIQQVLIANQDYSGSVTIGNIPYFASISPLIDADNNPIGMMLVAREQLGVLQTASRSIELTFVVTAILLVLSVIPSFFITRYISNQLH